MTTGAISAFGILFKMGDGATPENFTSIAELRDLKGPAVSLDTDEVTNHGSTGGWEEVIGTILRSGSITFDLNFIPTGTTHSYSTGLIKLMVNRTVRNFQLVFPNVGATTWTFPCLVTGVETSGPVAGALRASVTVKPTGAPTLA